MNALTRIDRLDELFPEFFRRLAQPLALTRDVPGDIKIDVSEGDKAYEVRAEVPGAKKDDIRVKVDRNFISISAEVKKEQEQKAGDRVLMRETYVGSASRGFSLAHEIDDKAVVAIDTFAEKHAASRAARRVDGVKAIALELDVKLAPDHHRSDTDIAASAEHALKWNTMVPVDSIRPTVDHGWVTLQGTVEWDYQRRAAEKAVRPLMGVVGVSNEVMLRVKLRPAELAYDIKEALTRQAVREAKRIQIGVDGGTVTLSGTVHSWQERDAAQGAAWAAPGVSAVVNELHIG